MSNPFDQIINYVEGYLLSLENGAKKAIAATPLIIKQEFISQARQNLKTSFSEYIAGLDISLTDGILIVELNGSWLAEAVEKGHDPFDMKETILTSPKAKISKAGFKYMSIPMQKSKTVPSSGTEKGMELQAKITQALKNPVFSQQKTSTSLDGTIRLMEQLVTSDPALKGLYRIQNFSENKETLRSTNYVMFRTISTNPLSKSQWQHPGIKPRRLFPRVESWADAHLSEILTDIIADEIENYMSSGGPAP